MRMTDEQTFWADMGVFIISVIFRRNIISSIFLVKWYTHSESLCPKQFGCFKAKPKDTGWAKSETLHIRNISSRLFFFIKVIIPHWEHFIVICLTGFSPYSYSIKKHLRCRLLSLDPRLESSFFETRGK